MNSFLELLLSNALAATMLAVLVAIMCLVVRRPAVRNALWFVVLLRLFFPPIWSVPVLGEYDVPSREYRAQHSAGLSEESLNIGSSGDATRAIENAVVVDDDANSLTGSSPTAIDIPPLPPKNEAPGVVADAASPTIPAVTPTISRSALPSVQGTPQFVLAIWVAGACLILVLAALRVMRFRRALVQDAVRAPEDLQQLAAQLASQLGLKRVPELWLVQARVPPMLWMPGLRRRSARIVLPAALMLQLGCDQRAALLAHELAHLRRGDPWVRWLEVLAQALYWWHPLLGWFRRRLRETEEQCCDALVVATVPARRAYATALVETVAFLNDGPTVRPQPLASGAAPVRQLQRRVGMIMRGTSSGRLTRVGLLAALGFAACALTVGPGLTQAQPGETKDRPTPTKEKKDRPFPPRSERPDADRPTANREELERARDELAKARAEAEKAMQRVREAEERMTRLMGGRAPQGGGGFGGRAPADRRPDGPPFGRGGEGGFGGGGGRTGPGFGEGVRRGEEGPPFARGEGAMPELARQIQELRQMVEELRRELHSNRGPDARPAPQPDRGFRRTPEDRGGPETRPAPQPDRGTRRTPDDRGGRGDDRGGRRPDNTPAERPAPTPAPERPTERRP